MIGVIPASDIGIPFLVSRNAFQYQIFIDDIPQATLQVLGIIITQFYSTGRGKPCLFLIIAVLIAGLEIKGNLLLKDMSSSQVKAGGLIVSIPVRYSSLAWRRWTGIGLSGPHAMLPWLCLPGRDYQNPFHDNLPLPRGKNTCTVF
jgi:hypothetical protein